MASANLQVPGAVNSSFWHTASVNNDYSYKCDQVYSLLLKLPVFPITGPQDPTVVVDINGHALLILIDSGAQVSVMSKALM